MERYDPRGRKPGLPRHLLEVGRERRLVAHRHLDRACRGVGALARRALEGFEQHALKRRAALSGLPRRPAVEAHCHGHERGDDVGHPLEPAPADVAGNAARERVRVQIQRVGDG